jgi:uncharacterized protein
VNGLDSALVLYARAPQAGAVKTRLTPWLDREEAVALHLALLEDSLGLLRCAAATTGALPCLAMSAAWEPDEKSGSVSLMRAAEGLVRIPQTGGDLGERLLNTFRELLGRGHTRIVVFGSDSPTLPPSYLEEALARLVEIDIVLGPAEDGGYYLIGARKVFPGMLAGVSWGTPRTLEETLLAIERAGARTALLPRWYDVDVPADLRRVRDDLRTGSGFLPEKTSAFIAALARSGRL